MNWRVRATLGAFSSILSQIIKKMKRDPFGKKNQEKKSHNAEKTERDPFVSPDIVCFAEKKKQNPGSTGTIWRLNFSQNCFGHFMCAEKNIDEKPLL